MKTLLKLVVLILLCHLILEALPNVQRRAAKTVGHGLENMLKYKIRTERVKEITRDIQQGNL